MNVKVALLICSYNTVMATIPEENQEKAFGIEKLYQKNMRKKALLRSTVICYDFF